MPLPASVDAAFPDDADAASPWKPFEDRRRDRDMKREAVLRVAVHLFLEQGYDRTSLNEVAERLNITKPALYNYFRNKEEILAECYALGQDMAMESLVRIRAESGTGLERLKTLIHAYCQVMTRDFGQCLVRVDDRVLTPERRLSVRAGKREIDLGFRDFVQLGIDDGSISPCDVRITTFAIAGAINWIGHWYRPDGALSADELGHAYAEQLTSGLAPQKASAG